ncbi:MAG: Flp pilus assembly protein CpaB [Chloroflexi bacterium]|nr:Flp pilus assembly protein CpaB [Chloroflexota bacterium]
MKRLSGSGALLVAVALGGLTSFLAWQYVRQAGQATRPLETAPVVVVTTSIAPRTAITPDMVRVQQLPVAARHPDAARAPGEVVGKVARSALSPEEQVLTTKLFLQREESGLAFVVPPGKRAVSVAFTELVGSGGLILPSDRVDVVGVFEVRPSAPGGPSGGQSTYVATLVLQNVEVLAIAQRIGGEDTRDAVARAAQDAGLNGRGVGQAVRSQPQPQPQAKTATLAVSPDEALRLVLAEERGKIRLALRRAGEDAVAPVPELPLSAIVQTRGR